MSEAVQNAVLIRNLILQKQVDDVLKPLHEQKSNLSLSIKALSVLSNSVQKNTIKYQKDIEQHCSTMIEQIKLKKQQLFEQLLLIETRKLEKIKTQRELLSKSQETVVHSLSACDCITNSDLKPYEKKEKLNALTNDALNALQIPPKLKVKPNVSYTIKDVNGSSFISSFCEISDDFLAPLPSITDMKCIVVSHESATINWNADVSSNNFQVTLEVTAVTADDHKMVNETDRNCQPVILEANKKQYSYELDGLSPNQQHNVRMTCIETNVSADEASVRSDFELISLTFKTKKAPPQLALFRFQSGHKTMKVSADGLRVTGCGQLRFGEYLKREKKQIYQVTFCTKDVNPEDCGIGFATKGFINTHNNHRMVVYGNRKVLGAKEFTNGKALSGLFWDKGDEIVIEINMKRKQGIMHRKFRDDIGIDRWDDFYRVDLPDSVAVCVRFASNLTQTLTVTHQKFV